MKHKHLAQAKHKFARTTYPPSRAIFVRGPVLPKMLGNKPHSAKTPASAKVQRTRKEIVNMELKIKQRLVGAAMIAALSVGILSCTKDPNRSSGRVMDDRAVKNRVEDALDDSQVYKFPHVDVNTYNGVVQLSGFVYRDEQKAVAADIARGIEGVREVINNISIVPQDEAYGGTVDPKTGVRGTGKNPSGVTTTNQTNQYRNPNQ